MENENPTNSEIPQDAKTMAMLCHLSGLFAGFVIPLIIWLIKKDQYPFVDDQGKEALNFNITIFLLMIVAFILTFIVIGFILIPLVGLYALIFTIIASIKANDGEQYRYPFAIRLIK